MLKETLDLDINYKFKKKKIIKEDNYDYDSSPKSYYLKEKSYSKKSKSGCVGVGGSSSKSNYKEKTIKKNDKVTFSKKSETINKIKKSEKNEIKNNNIIKTNNEKEKKAIDNNLISLIKTQDFIDGFWKKNDEFEKILEIKVIKEAYNKICKFYDDKNDLSEIKEKICCTFIVIYYIVSNKKEFIPDLLLIINKGKKFIQSSGYNYDDLLKEI